MPGGLPSVARVSSTIYANGVQQRGNTVFEIILHPQPVLESTTAAYAGATPLPGEDMRQTFLRLLSERHAAAPGEECIQASNAIENFVLNGAPDELISHYMSRRLVLAAVMDEQSRAKPIEDFSRILSGPKYKLPQNLIDIFTMKVESARALLLP